MLTERLNPVTLDLTLIKFVNKIYLSERLCRPPLLKRRGFDLKIDFRDFQIKSLNKNKICGIM